MLLEACYQKSLGKNVLVLEQGEVPYGAWKSLNLFGHSNVENAVHYLLPNAKAIRFLQDDLGLELEVSKSKYRAFETNYWGKRLLIKFDGFAGRLISYIHERRRTLLEICKFILLFMTRKIRWEQSVYFKNGSGDLTSKVGKLVKYYNKLKCFFKRNFEI